MPSVNIGDIVKPPVQTESLVENYRGQLVPMRTWYRFFLELFYRGFWNAVAYAAGNFTASGSMTWTVDAADQLHYDFTQVGKTIFVRFMLANTTVGGVADSTLHITIPRAHTANDAGTTLVYLKDNGAYAVGVARVSAGSTTIDITRLDHANFSLSADNTDIEGEVVIEIEG